MRTRQAVVYLFHDFQSHAASLLAQSGGNEAHQPC